MREYGCVPCALVLGENHLVLGESAILGVLVTRRQRLQPSDLVWSSVDKLCAGDVETLFLGGEAP